MAFQCNYCSTLNIGSSVVKDDEICQECYEDQFKHLHECTCTEHDVCSFCQMPEYNLAEEELL